MEPSEVFIREARLLKFPLAKVHICDCKLGSQRDGVITVEVAQVVEHLKGSVCVSATQLSLTVLVLLGRGEVFPSVCRFGAR
jgi:hypothetical protein